MRKAVAIGLFVTSLGALWGACNPSRGCQDTCALAIDEDCALEGMEDCETLCQALSDESELAGCHEEWLDLEYCMGLEPICAAHSRCGAERGVYNDCLRAFCDAQPDMCTSP